MYASEQERLIFDIRPGIPPVRSKARADVSSDFAEDDVIGVELCLVWMWRGDPKTGNHSLPTRQAPIA